jgi:SAM-dependent methyltransferase
MTGGAPQTVAAAYSAGGVAWAGAPSRIYSRLAELLVASCPVSLRGLTVLDVGAGTGVASRAAQSRGAAVVAVDIAEGMLAVDRARRAPAVLGDIAVLPIADDAVDVVVAAYSYNHLAEPVAGLREAKRVTRAGGVVLASTYAEDDTHPVREACEAALGEAGWDVPEALTAVRTTAAPKLATVERAARAAEAAGLEDVDVSALHVAFDDLDVDDLVEWRLGMAHTAWFIDALAPHERARVVLRVKELLGADAPPLVRSVIHVVART